MSQIRAVWSTEPEASFVPVQFQATECTCQKTHQSNYVAEEKLNTRVLDRNGKKPSSCDLDTLCYGGSWRVWSPPCSLRFQIIQYGTIHHQVASRRDRVREDERGEEEAWFLFHGPIGLAGGGPLPFWESNDFPPLFCPPCHLLSPLLHSTMFFFSLALSIFGSGKYMVGNRLPHKFEYYEINLNFLWKFWIVTNHSHMFIHIRYKTRQISYIDTIFFLNPSKYMIKYPKKQKHTQSVLGARTIVKTHPMRHYIKFSILIIIIIK